jgi:hypothetical protein
MPCTLGCSFSTCAGFRLLSHRVLAKQFDPELAHHRLEAHEPKALD